MVSTLKIKSAIGDDNIERFHRDSKIVEIYEGNKEVAKLVIARALLGIYSKRLN
jgi:alkylation response protein AidB-like acyl-CoA dehydrogenase